MRGETLFAGYFREGELVRPLDEEGWFHTRDKGRLTPVSYTHLDVYKRQDQYSGKVLVDVRWQDYGPVAKTVETGVMLHMGKLYGLSLIHI